MQHITHIEAYNFMTFNQVSLSFDKLCYIVKGQNLDNHGQQSNGSGKTSLVDIIAVALLGQSLTGRDVKDCVNWNGADNFFTVSVTLVSGEIQDGSDYEGYDPSLTTVITRKIYSNSRSAELSITINNQPVKGLVTKAGLVNGVDTKEGNRFILENILDISKDDLFNYFLISGSEYQSFFKATNSKKVEIISRFTKTSKVDQAISTLEAQLKSHSASITALQSNYANLEGQITALEQSIDKDAVKAFEDSKIQKIETLLQSIEQLEKQLDLLQDEEVDSTDYDKQINETSAQIEQIKNDIKIIDEERKPLVKRGGELETLLAGEIECPKCDHHFVLKSKQSVSSMKMELADINQNITELNAANVELIELKDASVNELDSLQSKQDEKQRIIKRNTSLVKQREDLKIRIRDKEQELVELDAKQFDDSGVIQKIKDIETKKQNVKEQLDSFISSKDKSALWIDRFKQFKFYLANKPVEIICHYTNQFLQQIESEFSIEIEGFKTLKSGELRAELTPIVYRNGVNPKPYNSFSEGEKVRLNIAVDLAMQRLINDNSTQGLDLYINDECLSALDSCGITNVAKTFNKLNRLMMMVTHSGAELNFENLLIIEKNGGASEIRVCLQNN